MIYNPIKLYELDRKEGGRSARWVNEEEGEILGNVVSKSGATVFYESGTANGISACWVAQACPDIEIHTFDPVDRLKVWDYDNVDFSHLTGNIQWHQEKFADGLDKIFKEGAKSAFFIDGDHSSGGLTEDWNAIKDKIKEGDVVVFHDLNIGAVQRFWARNIVPKFKTEVRPTRRIVGIAYI